MKKFLILLFLCLFDYSGIYAQNYIALYGGTFIDIKTGNTVEDAVIVIKDNKIWKAGRKDKIKFPYQTKIINTEGKYIIPGLIDGHIHFFQSGSLYTRPDGLDLTHRVPYSSEINWVKTHLDDIFKRYLACGITTVIDMGGPMWNFEVKKYAIEQDTSPRVFVAGPLIASYQPQALVTDDPPIVKVKTVEEALSWVQKEIDAGTDFIKIWYVILPGQDGSEFEPIVKAVIEEAHKAGKKVWVHAYELNKSVKRALKYGCDVLVHSVRDTLVDEEFIRLAKKNNTIYIPTLYVFESYQRVYSGQTQLLTVEHMRGNPDIISTYFDMYELDTTEMNSRVKRLFLEKRPIKTSEVLLKNLKYVNDHGIPVAAGTDAGNVGVLHGPALYHEFLLMKKAGLSAWDILKSATIHGAMLLDLEKQCGSIEPGKWADLVVLDANPLDDIMNVTKTRLVIKNGKIFYPDSLIKYTPDILAQIQLNAYNERNIEAFLQPYDDQVKAYQLPDGQLLFSNKNQMKEIYEAYFEKAENLHCQLQNRKVFGPYVMDFEKVSYTIDGEKKTTKAIAIYFTENQKIKKVWFIKK